MPPVLLLLLVVLATAAAINNAGSLHQLHRAPVQVSCLQSYSSRARRSSGHFRLYGWGDTDDDVDRMDDRSPKRRWGAKDRNPALQDRMPKDFEATPCICGSGLNYARCCHRLHSG
jgi:SEC-C motif